MGKGGYKGIPGDIIITILGPTGSGKTNFINVLTGEAERPSASSLKPDTLSATPYIITRDDHRLVLVEAPGFDDASRLDQEVVVNISDWLKQKYPDSAALKASGIIYLHRITDNRVSNPVDEHLHTFARHCGNIPMSHVCLVTTMWDKAKDKVIAEKREGLLTNNIWQKLLGEGAIAKRFDNTETCAWDIVQGLMDHRQKGGSDGRKRSNEADNKHRACWCL